MAFFNLPMSAKLDTSRWAPGRKPTFDPIVIRNIFPNKVRKKLIEDSNPHLAKHRSVNPRASGGATSPSSLHLYPEFKDPTLHILKAIKERIGMDMKIAACWIIWTRGSRNDIVWHTHQYSYGMVYYMKTTPFLNSGTLFRDESKSEFLRAPQNSLILFDPRVEHSPPASFLPFQRYSLVMDLLPYIKEIPSAVSNG